MGERLPANTSGSLDMSDSRFLADLNKSRSALVVDDGPDADEQAVGKTGCPDEARICEARCDENDPRTRWWEQVVSSSFACPFDDILQI